MSSIMTHDTCKICSISLLFDYMCTRLPFIPWSIAGVPSSQALPGYLITAPQAPSVCIPFFLSFFGLEDPSQSLD